MAVLRNANTGTVIASRVERAESWSQRAVGLLTKSHVASNEGLWFERCSAVHTLGMRAKIDIIFVDANHTVLRVCPDVGSGRWAVVCPSARAVIELGAGALQQVQVVPGDRLELVAEVGS